MMTIPVFIDTLREGLETGLYTVEAFSESHSPSVDETSLAINVGDRKVFFEGAYYHSTDTYPSNISISIETFLDTGLHQIAAFSYQDISELPSYLLALMFTLYTKGKEYRETFAGNIIAGI